MRSIWIFVVACVCAGSAGVFNEAQRNGPQRIAPGSIILINEAGPVGPSRPALAGAFPLATNLAGTSVRITVGDTAVDAYVLAAESQWVRALVPSNTPPGTGRVTVTYNGREAPAAQIQISERGFGIFDGTYEPPGYYAPSFRFPRAVHNVGPGGLVRWNSLADPARPGEYAVLWGTGLGAAGGNEAEGPVPAHMSIPGLAVFVGGKPARVAYAGRSGCCAGIDQIIFEVPPGIEGCNVPVWVRYSEQGHGSNTAYVSIKSSGGACSDPHGLSESESYDTYQGDLAVARFHVMQQADATSWRIDFGEAANGNRIPLGTCAQGGWELGLFAMDVLLPRDAGETIRIAGEGSSFGSPRHEHNRYAGVLSRPLEPGGYIIENGSGGARVPSFRAAVSIPPFPPFTWTNQDTLETASLIDGVTVTWSGGDSTGYVVISGLFNVGGESWGNGELVCYERADKGAFTIAPELLARLASDWLDRPSYPGAYSLRLSVGYTVSVRFQVPGFGIGYLQLDQRVDSSSLKSVILHP